MRKTIILLVVLSFVFISCSEKIVQKKVDNPADLYVQSLELAKKKKYDEAIKNFSSIRENFPFDPIAVIAQVKQGDVYFTKKEYLMAAGIYEDFLNSYPEDENAPYVLSRLAECYEKEAGSIDRDQANTFKAMERLTYLKNRHAASPYARDADARLKVLEHKLAAREFYVGEFYYRTGKYNASIMRLEYFLEKFPDAKDRDKALFYLQENYRELDRPEKSQQYSDRLKQEYPKSVLARSAIRERKTLRVAKADPIPAQVKTESAPAQAPPVAPAAFSFDERKKKEIILRPAAAQASRPENEPSKEDKAVETKDTITTESPTEAAKEAPETEKRAPTPVQKNVTGDKNAPESTRPNAYAGPSAKGETARKEQKQAGSKRDSLGFSEKKPVDVVADTMEGLEKGKIIVFRGNVIAKQEDLNLFSDILTAYVSEETNEIERAKAEGNVKIVKADRTATCKEAFFYNDKGEIILKGDVVVFSGKDKLSGDVVTYYINEDRVYVEGEKDKRAKATVHPK